MGKATEPLHIAPRRQQQQQQQPTYDPPAPLLPPLPGENEAPNPEEVELPSAESVGVGDWIGGSSGIESIGSGTSGHGAMVPNTGLGGRGQGLGATAVGGEGNGGAGGGNGAAPVVVACMVRLTEAALSSVLFSR